MSWFSSKPVEECDAGKFLLAKIENFRQITDEDKKLNRLWMYNTDDGFLYRVIDEIGEKEWKKYSPEIYRISSEKFTIEYQCDSMTHPDIQGTLSGSFVIHAKLSPGKSGFADFIHNGGIKKLERDGVLRDDQLFRFVQEVVSGPSISELNKSSAINYAGTAVSGLLPEWLTVFQVEIVSISEKLSEAQEKIQAYNRWLSDNEAELEKARQQLEFDVELANFDRVRSEIIHNRELAELDHKNKLELAQIQYDLEKAALRQEQQEELDRKRKAAELKIQYLQFRLEERRKIAESNRMIRDAEYAALQKRSEQETQLLELQIEKSRLEKQKTENAIAGQEKILQAQLDAIAAGTTLNQATLEFLQQVLKDQLRSLETMLRSITERIENILANQSAGAVISSYADAAQQLTAKVMAQNLSNPMMLDKAGLVINSRAIALDDSDVAVSGNYKSIKIDQPMQIMINAAKSGYLTLLCWGSDGKVTALTPNFADESPLLQAGMNYNFPQDSALGVGIHQAGPEGRDRLLALITPASLLPAPSVRGAFLDLDSLDIIKICRTLDQLPPDSWCAGYCTYLVEK